MNLFQQVSEFVQLFKVNYKRDPEKDDFLASRIPDLYKNVLRHAVLKRVPQKADCLRKLLAPFTT